MSTRERARERESEREERGGKREGEREREGLCGREEDGEIEGATYENLECQPSH